MCGEAVAVAEEVANILRIDTQPREAQLKGFERDWRMNVIMAHAQSHQFHGLEQLGGNLTEAAEEKRVEELTLRCGVDPETKERAFMGFINHAGSECAPPRPSPFECFFSPLRHVWGRGGGAGWRRSASRPTWRARRAFASLPPLTSSALKEPRSCRAAGEEGWEGARAALLLLRLRCCSV